MARRRRRRLPTFTHDEEFRLLLEHAPNETYRDLFLIMRHAGLRVSEAVSLQWWRVDFQSQQLFITGKGGVDRYVDMSPEVEAMLRRRFGPGRPAQDYVFPGHWGRPLTTAAVRKVMRQIRQRLGIPQHRMTPHKLRHAFATYLLGAGAPLTAVQAALGHANVATTSTYLHVLPGQLRRWMRGNSDD